jgi:hypothetical protein
VPLNVFVSVGRPFTQEQEDFISAIERYLAGQNLRCRTVGRTEFSHKQPLRLVNELLDRSAGVLVIALERISIEKGVEHVGKIDARPLAGESIPTPWSQIEAALAYAKQIPLLVIRETKVRAEGLLDARYDWYVHSTPLDSTFVNTAEFRGMLDSWLKDVRRRAGWFSYRN